jgi:carbamoyl-phosphate synthase large subunit
MAVKESVFPFAKFPGVDTILSPEMRSTGEVMGIAADFPEAFLKALLAVNMKLPTAGTAFISVRDDDKPAACDLAQRLAELGFSIVATGGTAAALQRASVEAKPINKVLEGRPHVVDSLRNGEIDVVINTTEGAQAIRDSRSLRRQTLMSGIPYFTTIAAATAAVGAIERLREAPLAVRSLQEYHATVVTRATQPPGS